MDARDLELVGRLENYQHAVRLYGLGFSLIPVNAETKVPVVPWKKYQTERCTRMDIVNWFLVQWHAIGIVTGALSGIVVVDCDDEDAVDTLLDRSVTVGDIEESLVRQKTKRGTHFFYRHPGVETPNTVRRLGAKVDVRGDGGYVRAYPGSLNFSADRLSRMPVFRTLAKGGA